MTIKTCLPWLLGLAGYSQAGEPPVFPKSHESPAPGFNAAFNEAAKVDFDIHYGHDGKFDLGMGSLRDGIRHPLTFTFDELRFFWEQQRHKDFIVVTLAKADLKDEQWRKLAQRITEYFFQCGFQHVRIHQAQGLGVGVLSDSTKTTTKTDTKTR
jgi:hypothetical protein